MLDKLMAFGRYPEFARLLWWRAIIPLVVRRNGVEIKKGVQFMGKPIISLVPGSSVLLGENVSLCSVSEYTALGVNHPVILRTLRAHAKIEIGAMAGISGASICAATRISIGKQCLIGANVVIADTDFHALKPENRRYNNRTEDVAAEPISIGDNVFLGTGVIVLKGVVIGDNSVIGAGSIVTRNIPANSVAAGNPAKVIGSLSA